MKLAGAHVNTRPELSALDQLPGEINYFKGNDPQKWRVGIAHYARVMYQDVYPGVSLIYYGNQRELEYDFVVAPGTDPTVIKLAFEGARAMRVEDEGDLVLSTAGGEVRQRKPLVYQRIAGHKQTVAGGYVIEGDRGVGFKVGAYDATKPLVIDPALRYATYLGGSGEEGGRNNCGGFAHNSVGIAVDDLGQAYVTGQTSSTDFPLMPPLMPGPNHQGGSDVFVTKFSVDGRQIVYSTYLGGDDVDRGLAIAVDGQGRAYITGETSSGNFPVMNALQTNISTQHCTGRDCFDAFVTRLGAAGTTIEYSTYLGGSKRDNSHGIRWDGTYIYVAGATLSPDFPKTSNAYDQFCGTDNTHNCDQPSVTQPGFSDTFVSKIDPSLPPLQQLVYSTYLGGEKADATFGIAVESSGIVYVAGSTQSIDFPRSAQPYQPTKRGPSDAYVAKLDTTKSGPASLLYSTYLGGSGLDGAFAIAADTSGNVYITGSTSSRDFPLTSGMQPFGGGDADAFVAKLNTNTSVLLYSTYLGGSGAGSLPIPESGMAIAVDPVGNAYVTGITDSSDFPTTTPDIKAGTPAFRGAVGVTGVTSWSAMSSSTGLTATAVKAFAIYAPPGAAAVTYAGGDAGVFISTDNGLNWTRNNAGLPNTNPNVKAIAVDGFSNTVYAGTPTGLFRKSNGAPTSTWTPAKNNISVNDLAIDPRINSQPAIYAATALNGVFKSTDGGNNWTPKISGLSGKGMSINSLVIDASAPDTLYAGTPIGVFKTLNGGDTWVLKNAGLTDAGGNPLAIVDLLLTTPATLYAAARDDVFGAGVFKSVNGGDHWVKPYTDMTPNPLNVNVLAVDPQNTNIIYAGTYGGILKSTSGGALWLPMNEGLTTPYTVALAIDPGSSTFYAGTTSWDTFITKLDPAGMLRYSSYLGGSANDLSQSIALYPLGQNGDVYIAGITNSPDFPILASEPPFQRTLRGDCDVFVVKLSQVGLLISLVQSLHLSRGLERAFLARLHSTEESLDKGHRIPACKQLHAFINGLGALSGRKQTRAKAKQLIADARNFKSGLGCR